jgi:hypothetical protein
MSFKTRLIIPKFANSKAASSFRLSIARISSDIFLIALSGEKKHLDND